MSQLDYDLEANPALRGPRSYNALRPDLPTMFDLPSETEEDGLPDEFLHLRQSSLLEETFRPTTVAAERVFVGADMLIYYDSAHPLWQKRPDWFAVLGVQQEADPDGLRMSYVMWQEGVTPLVVVELLSEGTEDEDLGQTSREPGRPPTKWEVYERILRVPYYVVFDRRTNQVRAFVLGKKKYREEALTGKGLWVKKAELWLRLWKGQYKKSNERMWLRWFDREGRMILTAEERAREAEERASLEAAARWDAEERTRLEAAARQDAEERAGLEAAARGVAEERAQDAEERAQDAEERARLEAAARQDAEERARLEAAARRDAEERNRRLAERLRAAGLDPNDERRGTRNEERGTRGRSEE